MSRAPLVVRARNEIARRTSRVYDVASSQCPNQILGNVAHMGWFLKAVAEDMAGCELPEDRTQWDAAERKSKADHRRELRAERAAS